MWISMLKDMSLIDAFSMFRETLCRFPEMGVPLNHPSIHGYSAMNNPAIGVPTFMDPPIWGFESKKSMGSCRNEPRRVVYVHCGAGISRAPTATASRTALNRWVGPVNQEFDVENGWKWMNMDVNHRKFDDFAEHGDFQWCYTSKS